MPAKPEQLQKLFEACEKLRKARHAMRSSAMFSHGAALQQRLSDSEDAVIAAYKEIVDAP